MTASKSILIGGITGGIGSAIAKTLHENGFHIAGFARNEEKLNDLKQHLSDIETFQADATDPDSLGQAFNQAFQLMGSIDVYIHAIGSIIIKPAHLTSTEHWMQTLQINLSSAFFAMKEAITAMQKQNKGSVLFLALQRHK